MAVSVSLSTPVLPISSIAFVSVGAAVLRFVNDGAVYLLVVTAGSGKAVSTDGSPRPHQQWLGVARAWDR